ncbi:hypothetical protein D7Y23_21685 [Corallococcus sp. AB050B]|nr:hypothetical protein D7Y23_21685 [Corallococcus sp. AB050B]
MGGLDFRGAEHPVAVHVAARLQHGGGGQAGGAVRHRMDPREDGRGARADGDLAGDLGVVQRAVAVEVQPRLRQPSPFRAHGAGGDLRAARHHLCGSVRAEVLRAGDLGVVQHAVAVEVQPRAHRLSAEGARGAGRLGGEAGEGGGLRVQDGQVKRRAPSRDEAE